MRIFSEVSEHFRKMHYHKSTASGRRGSASGPGGFYLDFP